MIRMFETSPLCENILQSTATSWNIPLLNFLSLCNSHTPRSRSFISLTVSSFFQNLSQVAIGPYPLRQIIGGFAPTRATLNRGRVIAGNRPHQPSRIAKQPMDRNLRKWFSRDTSHNNANVRLSTQSYDSTQSKQLPVRGLRPIAGNGPYTLDNLPQAKTENKAGRRAPSREPSPAPDVPRVRRYSETGNLHRPNSRSSFRSYKSKTNGSRRSTSATRKPATIFSWKYTSDPFLTRMAYNTPTLVPKEKVKRVTAFAASTHASIVKQQVRNVPQSPIPTEEIRRTSVAKAPRPSHQKAAPKPAPKSVHVDILDAATHLDSSRYPVSRKIIASGKRDYGEDVADRNITNSGDVATVKPQYNDGINKSNQKGQFSQENTIDADDDGVVIMHDNGGGKFQNRGRVRESRSRFEGDGIYDDTSSATGQAPHKGTEAQQQPTSRRNKYSARTIYDPPTDHYFVTPPPTLTNANTPTGSKEVNVDSNHDRHYNAKVKRQSQQPRALSIDKIDPATHSAQPAIVPSSKFTSITSAKSNRPLRQRIDSLSMSDPDQLPSATGNQSHRTSIPSHHISPATAAALAAMSASNQRLDNTYNPEDPLPSSRTSHKHISSQMAQLPPSLPRSSLDKDLPPAPGSHTHS
jgi:hypothetical protein